MYVHKDIYVYIYIYMCRQTLCLSVRIPCCKERIFNEHEIHFVYHLAAYAAEGILGRAVSR